MTRLPDEQRRQGGVELDETNEAQFARIVEAYLGERGCKGTNKGYDSKFKRWKEFNIFRGRTTILLEGMSQDERKREWIRFIMYLDGLGVKEHALKEHISAVKCILSYSSFNVNMDYADVSKCAFLKRVIESSKYTAIKNRSVMNVSVRMLVYHCQTTWCCTYIVHVSDSIR